MLRRSLFWEAHGTSSTPSSLFPQALSDNSFLWGNFAPVEGELFSADLTIEGTLPPELTGVFVRNGEMA
jgi:carotenoid cleavage dioxygenase-like enzyme